MKKRTVILLATAWVLCGSAVAAHHSAAQYDLTRTVEVTGVVQQFQAINPHIRVVLRVTDANGERDIEFEGHSVNNMHRAGYRDGMVKVGDRITVYFGPMRNGSDGGYIAAVLTASGKRFGQRFHAEVAREQATDKEP